MVFSSDQATASKSTNVNSLEIGKRYQLDVPASVHNEKAHNTEQADIYDQLNWQLAKVKKGDTLGRIFKRNGLTPKTTHQVVNAKGAKKTLTNINVGDELRLGLDEKGKLIKLVYPLSATKTMTVTLTNENYVVEVSEKQVEVRFAYANATVNSNFWNAGIESGMTASQIMSLANIFGWDIDFALDIREGDNFNVVYEERYVDGEYVGSGNILAAEFVNQGESYTAIRFTDGDYYTPEGNNMRKTFLRAPVNFKYISSSFKKRRFHPVQKRWKAHRGVDYAANRGTPVVAAGNGRVTRARYDKYNGHHVFIQHGDGIETKYLHFSKRAVKKGQKVKQGQVIGYVGSTGLAAGPHLHYEFLVNGVHRNPRTVKLPKSKPLAKQYREAFAQIAKVKMAMLGRDTTSLLAMEKWASYTLD